MANNSESTKTGLKRIAALIVGGVLALSVALPASADNGHDRGNGHAYGKQRNYDDGDYRRPGNRYGHYKRKHRRYDDGDYRRPGRHYGHYKRKHRKHKSVDVYHHYPRPVKRVYVEQHYYPAPEPQPVYVEPSYQQPYSGGYYNGGAGLSGSGLIGAAVGGLLGSQVGKGNGKLAATAGGAVAGYVIGSQH